ncbi:MAG: hypothetical protein IJJ47_13070 [Methanosphaera sp.]|nr:hypothetical protein [Methanosphaera sp.]
MEVKIITTRVTTYLDSETANKLNEYNNKSKVVKEALIMYFSNKNLLISKHEKVSQKIEQLEQKLTYEKEQLKKIEKQIHEADKKRKYRPEDYENSIKTLKSLNNVSIDDLRYQADILGVDVLKFKEWLLEDGLYDKLLLDK